MRNLLKAFTNTDTLFYVAFYAITGTLVSIGFTAVVILMLLGLTSALGV